MRLKTQFEIFLTKITAFLSPIPIMKYDTFPPFFPNLQFSWPRFWQICKNCMFSILVSRYCLQKKYEKAKKLPASTHKNCKQSGVFSRFGLFLRNIALKIDIFINKSRYAIKIFPKIKTREGNDVITCPLQNRKNRVSTKSNNF